MARFQNYEQRIENIERFLAKYGIANLGKQKKSARTMESMPLGSSEACSPSALMMPAMHIWQVRQLP